jgi:hypothetical protein
MEQATLGTLLFRKNQQNQRLFPVAQALGMVVLKSASVLFGQ